METTTCASGVAPPEAIKVIRNTVADGTRILTETKLPAHLVERLAGHGIRTCADWRALSRKRRASLFGIVPSVVRTLNEITGVRS